MLSLSRWLLLPNFNHLTSVLHNVFTKPLTAFPPFSSPYKCSVQAIGCFPHLFITFSVFCSVLSKTLAAFATFSPYQCSLQAAGCFCHIFTLPVFSLSSWLPLPHFRLTSVLSKQLAVFATFSPYQCSAQCSLQAAGCFFHIFTLPVFCTVFSPSSRLFLPHFQLTSVLHSVLSKQPAAFATFSPYQCSAQCSLKAAGCFCHIFSSVFCTVLSPSS